MSPHARVGPIVSCCCLLWLVLLSSIATAAAETVSGLTGDVSRFVPGCARRCFLSFVNVNYGTSTCGKSPSLDCLCSHYGASGLTLAHGALECVNAEISIGFCPLIVNKDLALQRARSICSDRPHAVRPTQDFITATLVVPLSGRPGVITIPPVATSLRSKTTEKPTTRSRTSAKVSKSASTTTSTTEPSGTLPTTLVVDTSSQQSPTSSLTAPTTSSTGGPAGSAESDHSGSDSSNSLPNGQLVGISIGAVAAVGAVIAAIFLCRYCRRRRRRDSDASFAGSSNSRENDIWAFWKPSGDGGPPSGSSEGGRGNGAGNHSSASSWIARQIQHPLVPEPPPPPPPPAQTHHPSWPRPVNIGLAVSSTQPTMRQVSPTLHQTPLLPAKPDMPPLPRKSSQRPTSFDVGSAPRPSLGPYRPAAGLNKPQPPIPPFRIPQAQYNKWMMPPTYTGRDSSSATEFEEDGRRSQLPSAMTSRQTSQPTVPLYDYYTSLRRDVGGNTSQSQTFQRPGIAQTAVWVPQRPAQGPPQGPTPLHQQHFRPYQPPPASRTVNHEESGQHPDGYRSGQSTRLDVQDDRSSSVYSQPQNMPQPLFSGLYGTGTNRRSAYKDSTRSHRAGSADSGVTIITTSSGMEEPSPSSPEALSPVVESPGTVVMPSTPALKKMDTSIQEALNSLPPPEIPNPNSIPSQPGPTLGIRDPLSSPESASREKENQRAEDCGRLRMGSPLPRPAKVADEAQDRSRLPSSQRNRAVSRQPPPRASNGPWIPPRPHSRHSSLQYRGPIQYAERWNNQLQHSQCPPPQQRQQPRRKAPPPYNPPQLRTSGLPPPRPPAQQDEASPQSGRTTSTSSSLLAKRIGPDRAAFMAMPSSVTTSRSRWRKRDLLSPEMAAGVAPPMTPRQGDDLPATPTWVPRLTPTRRGDDLYLNVQ